MTLASGVLSVALGMRFMSLSSGIPVVTRCLVPLLASCAFGLSFGAAQPLSLARYRRLGLDFWTAWSILAASAVVAPGALLTLWPLVLGFNDVGGGWTVGALLYLGCVAVFNLSTFRPVSRSHGRMRAALLGRTPRLDAIALEFARRSAWTPLVEPFLYGCASAIAVQLLGARVATGMLAGSLVFVVFAGMSTHNSLGREGAGIWIQFVYARTPTVLHKMTVAGFAALVVSAFAIGYVWLARGNVLGDACLVAFAFCWSGAVSQLASVLVPYRTGTRHPVMRSGAPPGHAMLVQGAVLLITILPIAWAAAGMTSPWTAAIAVGIGFVSMFASTVVAGRVLKRRLADVFTLLTHGQ